MNEKTEGYADTWVSYVFEADQKRHRGADIINK
jgi:hypothetical protein